MAYKKIDWTNGVAINPEKLAKSMAAKHDKLRELFEATKTLKAELEEEVTAWLVANHSKLPAHVQTRLPLPSSTVEYKYHYRGGITVAAAPKAKARAVSSDAIAIAK